MSVDMTGTQPRAPRSSFWKIAGIAVLTAVISVLATVWVMAVYLFPGEFKPVILGASEQRALDAKIERLRELPPPSGNGVDTLEPEPYSEAGAEREIVLTEKELNALLATNTDLARRLAIDLSDNLASAKLLVPLDEDFPVLGGKTVKLTAGVELAYAQGRPIVILKGVSIWGVPLPNAWLGEMKNVDLVAEFGTQEGFWRSFAAGVEEIEVEEGKLRIKLKE